MNEETYQKLLNDCFRFVSYRPHSEKEIREFLQKKLKRKKIFVNPTVIEKVILRLRDFGYVDDEKFAEWWVEQRTKNRPKGIRIIKQELLRKGIDKEVLGEYVSDRNEKALARIATEKIAKKIQKLPVMERKKKLYAYLSYRGFDSGTIMSVIDEMVGKGYNTGEDLNEDT